MHNDNKLNILVTGGAGYIGSHVVKQLAEESKHNITVLDNLVTGHESTLETLRAIYLESRRTLNGYTESRVDLANMHQVEAIIKQQKIEAVIHFAASIVVPESVQNPLKYYCNNTVNTIQLIDMCQRFNINKLIFSSTAAVYGEPGRVPIKENETLKPINPYGYSKLMSEQVLMDAANSNQNFKYVILRYFNASGADTKLRIGELHEPETHLIPLIAKTALRKRSSIKVYGSDYPTSDGTCIRDYIHVDDLANAHLKALDYLDSGESDVFNCGYGHGYSVQEVLTAMKKVSNTTFRIEGAERRKGDPATLVADNKKIKEKLDWQPRYDDLECICKTALEWERKI